MPPRVEEDEEGCHSDTIVVKGSRAHAGWSRPSSPGDMSPELEPLVTHLLASINTTPQQQQQQHLESPAPLAAEQEEEEEEEEEDDDIPL